MLRDSARQAKAYRKGASIFTQGSECASIMYLERGRVKLSVLSSTGKEAVVAVLEPGEFFGEGCLTDQPLRMSSAVAMAPSSVIEVPKAEMSALLKQHPDFSERFLA